MKKKLTLVTPVVVFLLSSVVMTLVLAQERTVGVVEGGWFMYGDFNVNWSSNNPNATFPRPGQEWLGEMNETLWMLMTVQDVLYTNVHFQITKHFKNGTEKHEGGYVNIDSGMGNLSRMAISANLDANDSIYTVRDSTWKINETTVRTYPDSERETNHLNTARELNITQYIDSYTINGTFCEFANYYWDRPTGILVEHSLVEIEQVGVYVTNLSMSFRLIESNAWVVPEFPTWTLIPLLLIVLTAIIYVHKKLALKFYQ